MYYIKWGFHHLFASCCILPVLPLCWQQCLRQERRYEAPAISIADACLDISFLIVYDSAVLWDRETFRNKEARISKIHFQKSNYNTGKSSNDHFISLKINRKLAASRGAFNQAEQYSASNNQKASVCVFNLPCLGIDARFFSFFESRQLSNHFNHSICVKQQLNRNWKVCPGLELFKKPHSQITVRHSESPISRAKVYYVSQTLFSEEGFIFEAFEEGHPMQFPGTAASQVSKVNCGQ